MPHLMNVDKGTFLLLREGVTSRMRAYFTRKTTKIQELLGASPPGPPLGGCSGPNGGLKAATNPMTFFEKIHAPSIRIPGSALD